MIIISYANELCPRLLMYHQLGLGCLTSCVFWQIQASIKKKVEKQRKQSLTGVMEVFNSNTKPKIGQKKNQPIHPPSRRGDDEEEEEEEPVEAGEPEEKEELDLTPIVDSVFGQVRLHKFTPCWPSFISQTPCSFSYSSLSVVHYNLQFSHYLLCC